MADNYFKNHPMYRKSLEEKKGNTENVFLKFEDEVGYIFEGRKKDIKILEVGLGNGDFAHFCRKKGFTHYTGVDVDDTYIMELKGDFTEYTFLVADIVEFLEKHEDEYDIIFMSHVFEHLPFDVAHRSVELIYKRLKTGGYWLNYMPNADSTKACGLRHIDITHQTIYNTNSLEQILFTNGANFSEIIHRNTLPAINPSVKTLFKIIHPFFLYPTKIYYYGMGLFFPRIYTSEMLSIMKK